MKIETAIQLLKTESCIECCWQAESPIKCNCEKCDYKNAVHVAVRVLEAINDIFAARKGGATNGND